MDKFPPNCGEVSSDTFWIPEPASEPTDWKLIVPEPFVARTCALFPSAAGSVYAPLIFTAPLSCNEPVPLSSIIELEPSWYILKSAASPNSNFWLSGNLNLGGYVLVSFVSNIRVPAGVLVVKDGLSTTVAWKALVIV